METTNKRIGHRIRMVRKQKKLTQEKFAALVGVSSKTISAYELGDILPTIDGLTRIAQIGNVTLDWIILGYDMPDRPDMTDEEIKLLQMFRQVDRENKDTILKVAENAAQICTGSML